MSSTKTLIRSFAGGEITPEMYGRLDNVKFQTGLALARNGIILPHGPFTKRTGFAYVNSAGDSSLPVRLIPFAFSATQTIVLEFGHEYLRFHTNGATLLDTGVPYEIITPYDSQYLFDLKFAQSADVVTITHPGYQAHELRRVSEIVWTLDPASFGTPIGPLLLASGVVGPGGGSPKTHYYRVTSVSSDGLEESLPIGPVNQSRDLSVAGNAVTLGWAADPVLTSPSYRIYKATNDAARLSGFIGETTGLAFTDDNITPDYSHNPPSYLLDLTTTNDAPAAVTYYEQRRVFGGSVNSPQRICMTRVATENNLAMTVPSSDEDAIDITIKAQQQNAIQHLTVLTDLLAFTVSGVWRVSPLSGVLLPSTVSAKPQNYYGSNNVAPQLTGSNCLYVEANGKNVRDISYSNESQGFTSDDRSVMAPHLFDGYTIVDAAFTKSPDKIYWCVRSDGVLLSMTFLPEHQVFAWSQHVTDGAFESVCVVAEDNVDVLYVVVLRSLNGLSVRCVERLTPRQFATQGDSFYVDCGATYSGAPATTISNLTWLEGEDVAVLADGAVVTGLTVSGGAITLPFAASTVHVGLSYTADMQLLPLAVDGAAAGGQGSTKALSYAYLRVNRTGLVKVGPSEELLREIPARQGEPYDSPPSLRSEQIDSFLSPDWNSDAQLWVRSDTPTPLTVSAIALKVSLGG
jgi:hypothetical protein